MNLEEMPKHQNDCYGELPEDATALQKMQYEIREEFIKGINNSAVSKVLEKYGLTAKKIIRFELALNLRELRQQQETLTESDAKIPEGLTEMAGEEIKLASCCLCFPWCCSC
ncbi:hypothetical protein NIES4101_60180 [Calothrix sp. NIES-4101]|nr:hypothetical protein NIES4101_60180 [Calothrix sp. NIES-4101]